MDLNKWYDKGLTPEEYLDNLEFHKESCLHIYNHFSIPDAEETFAKIKEKNFRVVALAEVWCGHCMLCVPIMLRIAEQAGMPVKFLPRDENLELMDQYQTNGKRIIPIFIFIDEDGNEVTKWGPMSETTKSLVDEAKESLPAKDADDYDEKFKAYIKRMNKELSENTKLWQGTYESIVKTLV